MDTKEHETCHTLNLSTFDKGDHVSFSLTLTDRTFCNTFSSFSGVRNIYGVEMCEFVQSGNNTPDMVEENAGSTLDTELYLLCFMTNI